MAIFAPSDWLPAELGISLDIHYFGTGFKMVSRFTTVSKDEILAVMKELHQQIPRNRQNFACRCLLVVRKEFSN